MKTEQALKVQRFSLALKVLKWQGGTIHQINKELRIKDLYALSNEEFIKVLKTYSDSQKTKRP